MKNKPKPRRRTKPATTTRQPEDLAVLLVKVFTHPKLPRVMWEFIADGLCELDGSFDKYENPEVMREVLGLNGKGGTR